MPVIPVVMGGGNYSRDLPAKSFIDVDDFESVQKLADYLHYLIQNHVSICSDLISKYLDHRKDL